MAFITKSGSRYTVRHGITGEALSSYSSRGRAVRERNRLHRKNMPKATNRGASARKRFRRRTGRRR